MDVQNPDESPLVKFDVGDARALRDYYEQNGYVVLRGALDPSLIDAFLAEYQRAKSSRSFVYFAQSVHRAMRPELNEHGFIRESMLHPSRLGMHPAWVRGVKSCIYAKSVSDALTALDGEAQHIAWQDMFFDLSTGTIEHQDTWYLDTDPPGRLVAAWFALENIAPEAGTFFVMPGSHKAKPLDRDTYPDHEEFRRVTLDFVREQGFRPKPMPLAKGDVLLWHPFTVHGAFSNRDPRYSRKSFTCHYFPSSAARQHKRFTRVERTENPALLRVARGPDLLTNLAVYGKYVVDGVAGRRPKMDMRRSSYSQ